MTLTPLTAYERETVIVLNDEDELATVTTHQRRILTKLERNPAARKVEDMPHGTQPGGRFEIDARLIRFGKPRRPLTAAQHEARAGHLRSIRSTTIKQTSPPVPDRTEP